MAAFVDNKTPRLDLPLPDRQNFLQDDVERLIETIQDLDKEVALVAADGKLEPAQLPDNAAKVDASGILLEAQLPVKVVTTDNQGKIPMDKIPAGALTTYHEASNDAQMLAMAALPGDICKRIDTGATYLLVNAPGSNRDNWREVPPSAVYSINGKTGVVTGLAASGENKDITKLAGLQGPLSLPADGVNPYDAVTVRQLASVTAGQGATMNGVMNNFIGAVEWFNGSRANLPAGYIPADGQEKQRTDAEVADLWAAVNNGLLTSVTDAEWLNSGIPGAPFRNQSLFSTGNGTTTFRLPDLNGATSANWGGMFLSGPGRSNASGQLTTRLKGMYGQAAPNVHGSFTGVMFWRDIIVSPDSPFGASGLNNQALQLQFVGSGQGNAGTGQLDFSAQKRAATYGADAGWLYPNHAVGLWIIRANGAFQAANTQFFSLASDVASPPAGTLVLGGKLTSRYSSAKTNRLAASFYASHRWGENTTYACIEARNEYNPKAAQFYFGDDGSFVLPNGGIIATNPPNGGITLQAGLTASGHLQTRPGNKVGLVAAEQNDIFMTNYGSAVPQGTWVNRIQGNWYNENWTIGGVRASNNTIAYVSMRLQTDTPYVDPNNGNTNYRYYEISIRHDGTVMGPSGAIQNAGSDIALKSNVTRSKSGALERINKFQTHEFTWNYNGRRDRGMIAQEIEHIDPLYTFQVDDIKNVSDRAILADLIDSVQTLTARNAELEARLAKLEA